MSAHVDKKKAGTKAKGSPKKRTESGKKGKCNQSRFLYDMKKKLKKVQFSKVFKKAVPYLIFGYFGNKITYAFRLTTDKNFFMRLVKCLGNLGKAFENIFPSFNGYDLLGGIVTGALIWFVVYIKKKNAKNHILFTLQSPI